MDNNARDKYSDMLHMPHPVSKKHPPMAPENRAAQFAPFAAVVGHEDAIDETARLTEDRIWLDDGLTNKINAILQQVKEQPKDTLKVRIRYFLPDDKKEGGSYPECTGTVRKIDEYKSKIIMSDNTEIVMDNIVDMERI
ncbi:MAG: YolD-like family protein [Lachnospiraceae bacterium]|nr:YolD-like family protein [Lachnospiraceae bacterium]